jgi:2-C-methyl-D-erythritol 4-phosphate cytidylyltransferase
MGQVSAVIVAAGTGSRMGVQATSKQFLPINGRPILAHTLLRFETCPEIDRIVLVIREEERGRCEQIVSEIDAHKVSAMVAGGKERQDSVWNGLSQLSPQTEIVLIHDAVRMFVTHDILTMSIQYAREWGGSIAAVPAKDTIKTVTSHQNAFFVESTLDRSTLWQVQTPQTFQYPLICDAHQRAHQQGFYGTDDAMLMEHFGHPVKIVPGSYRNIKITTPDDLLIAEAFLRDEERGDC